jgi:hypothetical protein
VTTVRYPFYKLTAYDGTNKEPVPPCFVALDAFLKENMAVFDFEVGRRRMLLAENLCRRMADVDYFAMLIGDAINAAQAKHQVWGSTVVVSSLAVAHFSACKSLLDAAAIALNELYGLGLDPKKSDFGRPHFWNVLKTMDEKVHARYAGFRDLAGEIIDWRDSAVHRIAPVAVIAGPNNPQSNTPGRMSVMLSGDHTNLGLTGSVEHLIEPLHFHLKWRPRLLAICKESCTDVEISAPAMVRSGS